MPRKGHVPKREVMPDPIYQDKVITKLINNIMLDGKRGIVQGIVFSDRSFIQAIAVPHPIRQIILHRPANRF